MSRGTQDPDPVVSLSDTGLSPAPAGLSSAILLASHPCCRSYNPGPACAAPVWANPLSLATTYGILSSPPGT